MKHPFYIVYIDQKSKHTHTHAHNLANRVYSTSQVNSANDIVLPLPTLSQILNRYQHLRFVFLVIETINKENTYLPLFTLQTTKPCSAFLARWSQSRSWAAATWWLKLLENHIVIICWNVNSSSPLVALSVAESLSFVPMRKNKTTFFLKER